jgi:hypothetical protein
VPNALRGVDRTDDLRALEHRHVTDHRLIGGIHDGASRHCRCGSSDRRHSTST